MDNEIVSAAGTGDVDRIQALLKSGANIEAHAIDDWTPLTAAVSGEHEAAVKCLLEAGANVNGMEGGGNKPLFWAAFRGNANIVRELLVHGADPKIGRSGQLPSDVAKENRHSEVEFLLKSKGPGSNLTEQ